MCHIGDLRPFIGDRFPYESDKVDDEINATATIGAVDSLDSMARRLKGQSRSSVYTTFLYDMTVCQYRHPDSPCPAEFVLALAPSSAMPLFTHGNMSISDMANWRGAEGYNAGSNRSELAIANAYGIQSAHYTDISLDQLNNGNHTSNRNTVFYGDGF
jgi:hypothetical protein